MLRWFRKQPFRQAPTLFTFSNQKRPIQSLSMREEYRKLYGLCSPEINKYIYCGFLTLINAAVFMYLPNIYTDINEMMNLKISTHSQNQILQVYLMKTTKWLAIFMGMGITTYLRRYEFLNISNRLSVRFRTVLYNHVLMKNFYQQNRIPQTYVHHLITDVKGVCEFTSETVFMGVRGFCLLVGGIGCLLYTCPYITLISIAIMSVFNILFRGRNQRLKHLKEQENLSLIRISEFVSERFHSLRFIKISNTELFQNYRFALELQKFYNYSKRVARANGLNYGSLEGLGLFSLFLVAASGSLLNSFEITNFSLLAASTYAVYVALGFRSMLSFDTELVKMMAIYSNITNQIGTVHHEPLYHLFLQKELHFYQKKIEAIITQHSKEYFFH